MRAIRPSIPGPQYNAWAPRRTALAMNARRSRRRLSSRARGGGLGTWPHLNGRGEVDVNNVVGPHGFASLEGMAETSGGLWDSRLQPSPKEAAAAKLSNGRRPAIWRSLEFQQAGGVCVSIVCRAGGCHLRVAVSDQLAHRRMPHPSWAMGDQHCCRTVPWPRYIWQPWAFHARRPETT